MEKVFQKFSKIPTKTLLYLFIASSIVCVLALRHNNQMMVELRSKVYAADKDNKDVNAALNDLRRYVYGHMNTNLSSGNNNIKPPIQLKYTYQRLAGAQLSQLQVTNSKIYEEAHNYCQPQAQSVYSLSLVACVQNYVVNHGVKDAGINIPAGLYGFDFISPAWSPDLAGWSLIVSLLLALALIVKFGISKFLN